MCTLAVAFATDPRWPLVVAANRDERLGRPAEGWAVREPTEGPRHAAPRDLVGGGTWIGVSATGLFAAVTNYHTGHAPDPARRTRGELVPLALRHADAASAREALARLDAAAWNPFHLLVADAERAFLWWYDRERSGLDDLAPGLHVVTESAPEDRGPRGEAVHARWPLEPDPARLREVLTLHGPAGEATCVHAGEVYGTRSAAVLRLARSLGASELYAADGRPCQAPLEDRSRLLHGLR
jgi:uncharacterized protein with NRDE domain